MSSRVSDVMVDLIEKLQSIAIPSNPPLFAGKVFDVYDTEDLSNLLKGTTPPLLGVSYEGIISSPSQGSSGKIGLSAHMVVSIILVMQPKPTLGKGSKNRAIDLLDLIRSNMMATRSATNHYWEFMVEAPADRDTAKNLVFWVQRWRTPIQLPHVAVA